MFIHLSFAMLNADNTLWITVFNVWWSLTVSVANIAEERFRYQFCLCLTPKKKITRF